MSANKRKPKSPMWRNPRDMIKRHLKRRSTEHLSERRALKTLPLDLRLGTKLRIESQKPFPWMLDDRPGCNAALQEILQYLTKYLKSESLSLTTNISSVARLEASTLYWQFPNIPWTPTFPRFDAARRFIGIKKERAPSINSLGKVFSDSLVAQFSAFNHLFFSWKKGNRHDFYLCCSAFTVLFTKIQKKNSNEAEDDTCSSSSCTNKGMLNIIITPTTSGFRQQLREEGLFLLSYLTLHHSITTYIF
uniref:Uncharacterized protein n=1 Tax=Syphacia muris TaxID=451379 RepID=A0A0N5A9P9_9BILA